jgi:hypothetical protein
VFLEGLSDSSSKRGILSWSSVLTDLVPRTIVVSRVPYRMPTSELKELRSQLKDFLEKRFVRSSVLP